MTLTCSADGALVLIMSETIGVLADVTICSLHLLSEATPLICSDTDTEADEVLD